MATNNAILDRIVASRRTWVEELRDTPFDDRAIAEAPTLRDFHQALTIDGVALIAECKQRSPSAGILQAHYDPVALAKRYVANGASAISVLTEPEFFGGSFEDLKAVHAAVEVPVLCKDFIIDEVQLTAARLAGADAVLLIVALLDDDTLLALNERAELLGMRVVVEVHDEVEMGRALQIEPEIIGINNRDLTSMRTDRTTTARLRALVPEDSLVISESGIGSRADIDELARMGIDAALVGESLLRASDLEAKVRELSGR